MERTRGLSATLLLLVLGANCQSPRPTTQPEVAEDTPDGAPPAELDAGAPTARSGGNPGATTAHHSSADEATAAHRDGGAQEHGSDSGLDHAGSSHPTQGTAATTDGGAPPEGFTLAPSVAVSFTPSDEDIFNPERGFYRYIELTSATNLTSIAEQGYSLVYSYVRLDEYREGPIAESTLRAMNRGLQAVRAAGLKVILRFAYNFGPYPDSEPDASKAVILEHITQLQPHLAANEDVIALVQAGFIGAWGEWHTSTHELLADPADRKEILEALLEAVPKTRTTALRYPAHKREMYGEPLSSLSAFDGSNAARTGHHNDCFLSSDTDVGTYPVASIEELKDYLAEDTAYVPMGGETCALHARSACETAQAEMANLHFSYLNLDYHEDVIDHWESNGCLSTIRRGLGYRLELVSAKVAPAVRPGGAFELEVTLQNVGFAAPFNPRPVHVVLLGKQTIHRAVVQDLDPRRWLPGAPIVVRLRVTLPSDIATGEYSLALALPDPAPALAERAEYAIRFANQGAWQDGYNVLAAVTISADAPGDTRSDVEQLTLHRH